MSDVRVFVGPRPPVERRAAYPAACPLCGQPMLAQTLACRMAPPSDACRLGFCAATPAPGSIEDGIVAANREILRADLLEVEFGIAALGAITDAARARGTPCVDYLQQRFALVLRRNILQGYLA